MLVNSGQYRLEADDLFLTGCVDSLLKTTSAMMTLEKDTIIVVHKLYVNTNHPDMFYGYIPSMDAFITVSFCDVCCWKRDM